LAAPHRQLPGIAIGGLVFELDSPQASLTDLAEPRCASFVLAPSGGGDGRRVRVRIGLTSREPEARGRTIFESDATWSLLANEGERLFVFREPGVGSVLYVARFRPGSDLVELTCSTAMLDETDATRLPSPFRYPLDQVLTLYSLGRTGLLLHAAGLAFEGRGVVFSGVSGAGKSTIAGLAAERPGWLALSDDRIVLRFEAAAGVRCHGTPWPGEGQIARSDSAPAAALLFIEQAATNEVRALPQRDGLQRLFRTASVLWFDTEHVSDTLAACGELVRRVPPAVLRFRPETGAVELVEGLLGGA
jgi:hypothetical protein